MKVAVYHALPPGGALRVLREFLRRSSGEHEYHLFTVDLGPFDSFAYARDRAERYDLASLAARSTALPVVPAALAGRLPAAVWTASGVGWMDRAQRRVAARINAGGFDVAFVHPCRVNHTPWLMRYLTVPSLHFMQEHRRRSFESGYQAADRSGSRLRRVAAAAIEHALRRGDRAAALAADRIVCNSYFSAECIQRSYGRNATVCYPGVDTDAFDLGTGGRRRPAVVAVGALEREKGQDLVVRALGLLPPQRRPALEIAFERCDPRYRAEVESLAASGGVELRLHQGISDREVAALYRRARATVLTARLEPFGLVPLESMACGTPVVALREGGYRETVAEGVNGYLVDRSLPDIAAAVDRLVAGGLGRTPEQVRGSVVHRWGWDDAVKRMVEQLEATVRGGR